MSLIERIEAMEAALTVEALGSLLTTSSKTLYKAIKAGRIPSFRIGGSIRLDPAEVAAWLRTRHTAS